MVFSFNGFLWIFIAKMDSPTQGRRVNFPKNGSVLMDGEFLFEKGPMKDEWGYF